MRLRLGSALLAVALAVPVLVADGATRAGPAAAWPTATVDLLGHGFGHGRGMGQWGALGYAVDGGWDHGRILDHYYGGTVMGTAGNPLVDVQLTRFNDADTLVQQERGNLTLPDIRPGQRFAALRVRREPGGTFAVDVADDCSGASGLGPWPVLESGRTGPIRISTVNQGEDRQEMLQVCEATASRWLRGDVLAMDAAGATGAADRITVNRLPLESYLRGVVPRESPASWGGLGERRGMNALRAQAVAARSYALAEDRPGPAKTCDTASCQVYGGRAVQVAAGSCDANGSTFCDLEGAGVYLTTTDQAVAETAGQVRTRAGAVVRAEFSSSTGGWTAGGAFPAVFDAGDSYAGNPHHTWTAKVPVADIEARYARGTLERVEVRSRNGLGDEGGRVLSMRLVFSQGSVDLTGDDFRLAFGLRSNWFSVVNLAFPYHVVTRDGGIFSFNGAQFRGSLPGIGIRTPARDMAEGPGGGYWILGEDGGVFSFDVPFYGSMGGQRLNQPVVGMSTTATALGYWLVAGDGGIFSFGDAQFFGSTGDLRLNQPVVGMAPTPSGQGYWLVATDGGVFTFGDGQFLGSTGDIRLNQPVFAMAATASGRGYWLVARDGGIFTFGDAPFLGSLPERNVRETAVELLPSPSGFGYLIVTREGRVHAFGDAGSGGGPADVGGGGSPSVGAGRAR